MTANPEAEDLLCWECIADPVLRQWVKDNGHAGRCTFCDKRRVACTMPEVAREIDDTLREFYRPAEETAHIVEESDNPQYWADGQDATEVIEEAAGVERSVAEAIDSYMSEDESRDVRDGADAFYGGTLLEHIAIYPHEFMGIWLDFEMRLKHEVRFFDEAGRHSLDELFAELPSIAGGKAIVTVDPGADFSTLYRARIADQKSDAEAILRNPGLHLGPPPVHRARAGRMNPIGIPAFYGAFSADAAIAEVRPPVGSTVAVGKFILLRTVRLLDVSFLPFAYHDESIFSPSYDHLRNKVGFLEKFHRRISRPVLPSDEALEYLPTQAVAAYVQNVMGLDGMIYGSTQVGAERDVTEQVERSLCNVVLFGDAARVQGGYSELRVAEPPEPKIFFPGMGRFAELLDPIAEPEAPLEGRVDQPAIVQPLPDIETTNAPVAAEDPAVVGSDRVTLRVEPQPDLVRITSVKVETSAIFGHLYDDGSILIRDYEDDDD